jgi:hypothetical protein
MTGFVREVRALLDRTARGGKRRWLCARLPGFVSALDPLDLAPPEGGWKSDARLRVQTLAPLSGQRLVVKLNGVALVPTDDLAEPFPNPDPPLLGTPETLAAWIAPAALLRDGSNHVETSLRAGEPADLAFIDLAVR